MRIFKHLKPFLKKNSGRYLLGVLVVIFIDVLQLIMPKVMGQITDDAVGGNLTVDNLLKYIGIIISVAIVINLGRVAWRILIMGAARTLQYWLRNKLFEHLEKMSKNYFNESKTGDLMAHATNDVKAVSSAFGPGVVMMVDAVVMTMLVISRMFAEISFDLAMLSLIPLLMIAFTVSIIGKEVMSRFNASQKSFGDLSDKVQENISGIRVVKSFVQYHTQFKIFDKANKDYFRTYMRDVKLMIALHPFIRFLATISMIIAIGYGGNLAIMGKISVGELIKFIMYLGLLIWPMMAVGMVINNVQRGVVSMKRLNKILDVPPEIKDNNVDESVKKIKGSIEFRGLDFKYTSDGENVLSDVNLKIREGETLALIGRTGSGKTTLINLLLRNYNVDDGKILIDGKDINDIPISTLRGGIGYVPQENFLFSKSILDNIALSKENISFEEVDRAAELAVIKDEILNLPQKYETELGERGVNLSGGQKQRTSIARAIVKEPSVLILDDSLSAVDTNTEEKILRGLQQVMKDRTSIIISHRISTIKDSDHIAVLDEGKIVQYGTHESLLQEGGLYREIYQKQQLEDNIRKAN